jgi:hypothetical protein
VPQDPKVLEVLELFKVLEVLEIFKVFEVIELFKVFEVLEILKVLEVFEVLEIFKVCEVLRSSPDDFRRVEGLVVVFFYAFVMVVALNDLFDDVVLETGVSFGCSVVLSDVGERNILKFAYNVGDTNAHSAKHFLDALFGCFEVATVVSEDLVAEKVDRETHMVTAKVAGFVVAIFCSDEFDVVL